MLLLLACLAPYVHRHLEPSDPQPPKTLPEGLSSLSAKECGGCHAAIYQEWSASMMGQAWTDPVFQADFQHQGELYVCRNCHTPLVEQQPELVLGLEKVKPLTAETIPNPDFQPELLDEGVTCVSCHLQEGRLVGPHEDVDPPHAWAVGDLTGDCEACHQMPPPPFWRLERDVADTHRELERWQALTGRTEGCVDCHMPAVERPLVEGYPSRPGRAHTFVGSWDHETLRSAVSLRAEGGTLFVTNHAGHAVPTAEPSHVLRLSWRGVEAEELWYRDIRERKERGDSSLREGEVRAVPIPAGATGVALSYERLALMPEVVQQAVPPGERSVMLTELSW